MKPVIALRHARDGKPTIENVFAREGLPLRYADLFDGEDLEFHPDEVAGLVVLGGAMNTDETDRHPYLLTEIDWIRRAIAHETPVLGICLGAQLLATALDARVSHHPTKEIGWYEIEVFPAARHDRLCGHLAVRETIFQWHGDTFELPRGAVQLARSSICEQQAFRFGERTWGLQFHPEVTAEIIEQWLTEPAGCAELTELDYIDPARIRAETPALLPRMQSMADRLFAEFAALCREHGAR